jgi:hypothetical protein
MTVKIALFQKGLMATYHIDRIDDITVNARLRSFSGDSKPPAFIKLFKTDLGWRSAFDDAELIRELGDAIG